MSKIFSRLEIIINNVISIYVLHALHNLRRVKIHAYTYKITKEALRPTATKVIHMITQKNLWYLTLLIVMSAPAQLRIFPFSVSFNNLYFHFLHYAFTFLENVTGMTFNFSNQMCTYYVI